MRILHVTRELPADRRFGIGRSLDPVIAALQADGHDVRYLAQDELSPRAQAWRQRWTQRALPWMRRLFGLAGEHFWLVWIERLIMGRMAAKVAVQMQADAVHLHDPWLGWGFRLTRRFVGAGRCRWGISEHGFGSYTWAIAEEGIAYTPTLMRLNRWLERSLLAAADWVICPAQSGREQLARDLGLPTPPRHWHVVPHACPKMPTVGRSAARQQLGWTEGEWHVLAVGRLNPVKRFEALLQACLLTRRALHLTLLGEGDVAHLERQLAAAPDAMVTLRHACVDDVAPYLAAADVYLCSARNESFGLANLEALAAGLPAICTAAGAIPEVTGGAARLVGAGDIGLAERLASALLELMDDAPQRRRWQALARQHAAAWPPAKAVAARLLAIYEGRPVAATITPVTAVGGVTSAAPDAAPARPPSTGPVEMGNPDVLCELPAHLDLSAARRVLVFAPHPDDESIGCGGALALLARAGVPVRVVLVSDGGGAGGLPPEAAALRQLEFTAALATLGLHDHLQLGLVDGALAGEAGLQAAVQSAVADFAPDCIIGPSRADSHRDHRAVAQAVATAAQTNAQVVKLLEYETWGQAPLTHVLDISAVIETKLAAIAQHHTALACGNYLQAAAGLALHRGLLLGTGKVAHGEGYVLQDLNRSASA